MADLVSRNMSRNGSLGDTGLEDEEHRIRFALHVATCIISAIGLPLTIVAIVSLYFTVKKDNVAPIYVINLLLSDLIQLCCMIVMEAEDDQSQLSQVTVFIYSYLLHVSVSFMVCVSLERYLFISFPMWYRFRRTIKSSVFICACVWVFDLAVFLVIYFGLSVNVGLLISMAILLLPFPLLVFFLVGTSRALCASIAVPDDEKRRIVGTLVLVVLIYTLLFLPYIIFLCYYVIVGEYKPTLELVALVLIQCSPLADLALYIFMRKGAKLLTYLCCCKMNSDESTSAQITSVTIVST